MAITAALVFACALAACGERATASRTVQTTDDRAQAADASLDRVRAALQKPPSKLTPRDRPPDFSISIWERQRVAQLMTPILDFTVGRGLPQNQLFTASPFQSQPAFSVDLLSMALAAATAVNAARRTYAKRAAVEEVRRIIEAYCAMQPNGGGGIAICSQAKR